MSNQMKTKKIYQAPETEISVSAITCYLMNDFGTGSASEPGSGGEG